MKRRTILAAGVLALGMPMSIAHGADAMTQRDCIEMGTPTEYSSKCPARPIESPIPRNGVFMGYGDVGDDQDYLEGLRATCWDMGGTLYWYGHEDDSFWCEDIVPVMVSSVTIERTSVELGVATPIVANPKFMG